MAHSVGSASAGSASREVAKAMLESRWFIFMT